MAQDSITTRYAEALFETASAEGLVDRVLEELTLLGTLLAQEPSLREFFWNPDVEPKDKIAVLDRAVQGQWSALVRAFLQMTAAMGRVSSLPGIIEAFGALVDEARKHVTVVVRSARPLGEGMLNRLQERLAAQERKTITLRTEVDPALLGGLQVRLDHRVIDGSVRRQLDDLRQQLKTVRVT